MIRRCTLDQYDGWLDLREALWPDSESDTEIQTLLSTPERNLVLAFDDANGETIGFAEASIRTDYVNGTHSSPVAFLEGLYVQPASRGQGVARQLVMAVQRWAQERGCTELASDALMENAGSHAMHEALGFVETERVVYFQKKL